MLHATFTVNIRQIVWQTLKSLQNLNVRNSIFPLMANYLIRKPQNNSTSNLSKNFILKKQTKSLLQLSLKNLNLGYIETTSDKIFTLNDGKIINFEC